MSKNHKNLLHGDVTSVFKMLGNHVWLVLFVISWNLFAYAFEWIDKTNMAFEENREKGIFSSYHSDENTLPLNRENRRITRLH